MYGTGAWGKFHQEATKHDCSIQRNAIVYATAARIADLHMTSGDSPCVLKTCHSQCTLVTMSEFRPAHIAVASSYLHPRYLESACDPSMRRLSDSCPVRRPRWYPAPISYSLHPFLKILLLGSPVEPGSDVGRTSAPKSFFLDQLH
jgi:hypothetical protein